jgi:hypothetical protein
MYQLASCFSCLACCGVLPVIIWGSVVVYVKEQKRKKGERRRETGERRDRERERKKGERREERERRTHTHTTYVLSLSRALSPTFRQH